MCLGVINHAAGLIFEKVALKIQNHRNLWMNIYRRLGIFTRSNRYFTCFCHSVDRITIRGITDTCCPLFIQKKSTIRRIEKKNGRWVTLWFMQIRCAPGLIGSSKSPNFCVRRARDRPTRNYTEGGSRLKSKFAVSNGRCGGGLFEFNALESLGEKLVCVCTSYFINYWGFKCDECAR